MIQQVVICCAEEDEPSLALVMAALHEQGLSPELVPGMEHDPMRLGAVVDAQNGPTLYVFCESERFRARVIRQAQGVLGARKGPADATLIVELTQSPKLVTTKILGALGEREAPQAAPVEDDKKALMRDVVRLREKSARPQAASNPAAPAEADEAQAQPSWRAPRGGGAADPGMRLPGRSAQAGAGDALAHGVRKQGVVMRGGRAELEEAFGDVIVPASSDPDEEPGDIAAAAVPALPDESPGWPHGADAPQSRPPSPTPGPERGGGLRIAAWMGVLVAVAATAWVISKSDLFESRQDGARGAPTVAAQSEQTQADSSQPEDAGDESAAGIALSPGEDAPEGSSDAIVAAVKSGKLRVLNLLYVSQPERHESNLEGATAYCSKLNIAGLGGFRLPGGDELKGIRHSNMLERGRFWSSRPAGEGFSFVLDTDAGTNLVSARTKFRSARAICVRSL